MAPAQAFAQQAAPVTKNWLKYYSEHLPEAKKMMHECLKKGNDKLQNDEKTRCGAARDAWHFQPYKPSKK